MNDTHGADGKPWTGFDLDGTLAVYDEWEGIDHIGSPIKPMVDLIKKLHEQGERVKILTARVSPRANPEYKVREKCAPPDYVTTADFSCLSANAKTWVGNMYLCLDTWGAREFVIDWCLRNLGFLPEITHEKDHLMVNLYDDRVTEVVPNQGITIQQRYEHACQCVNYWRLKYNGGSLKYLCFLLGLGVGFVGAFLLFFCCVTGARDVPRDAAVRLHKASEDLVGAIDNYNASCTTQKIGPIEIPPKKEDPE